MNNICDKSKCTGCFACVNKCPEKCIEMKEDALGFIYPQIDNSKCIDCKLCEKTCPVNNKTSLNIPKKVFAAWSLDKEERKSSSSGGIAAELSKYYVEQGGVVYGACIDNDLKVIHKRIDCFEDLALLKQSKYVQSSINESFENIKKDLELGKKVLFVGTPCQAAGLRNYLGKEDNLLICDIICHGVPPYKLLKEYIDSISKGKNITSYKFRNGNEFSVLLYDGEEKVVEEYYRESTYFTAFMEGLLYRNHCYDCEYAKDERVGDITLGDFWGIGETIPFEHDIKNGVSVILCNTYKGISIIEPLKNKCFMEERTLEEAKKRNEQLNVPSHKNSYRKTFEEIYLKKGFNKAVKKCCAKSMIKYKIKKILKGGNSV